MQGKHQKEKVNCEFNPNYKGRMRKQSTGENLGVSIRSTSTNNNVEGCAPSERDKALQPPANVKLKLDPKITDNAELRRIERGRERLKLLRMRWKKYKSSLQNDLDHKHFENDTVNHCSQAAEMESVGAQINNEVPMTGNLIPQKGCSFQKTVISNSMKKNSEMENRKPSERDKALQSSLQSDGGHKHLKNEKVNCCSQAAEVESVRKQINNEVPIIGNLIPQKGCTFQKTLISNSTKKNAEMENRTPSKQDKALQSPANVKLKVDPKIMDNAELRRIERGRERLKLLRMRWKKYKYSLQNDLDHKHLENDMVNHCSQAAEMESVREQINNEVPMTGNLIQQKGCNFQKTLISNSTKKNAEMENFTPSERDKALQSLLQNVRDHKRLENEKVNCFSQAAEMESVGEQINNEVPITGNLISQEGCTFQKTLISNSMKKNAELENCTPSKRDKALQLPANVQKALHPPANVKLKVDPKITDNSELRRIERRDERLKLMRMRWKKYKSSLQNDLDHKHLENDMVNHCSQAAEMESVREQINNEVPMTGNLIPQKGCNFQKTLISNSTKKNAEMENCTPSERDKALQSSLQNVRDHKRLENEKVNCFSQAAEMESVGEQINNEVPITGILISQEGCTFQKTLISNSMNKNAEMENCTPSKRDKALQPPANVKLKVDPKITDNAELRRIERERERLKLMRMRWKKYKSSLQNDLDHKHFENDMVNRCSQAAEMESVWEQINNEVPMTGNLIPQKGCNFQKTLISNSTKKNAEMENCTPSERDKALQFPANVKLKVDHEITDNNAELIKRGSRRFRRMRWKRVNSSLQNDQDHKSLENEKVNCCSQVAEVDSVGEKINNEVPITGNLISQEGCTFQKTLVSNSIKKNDEPAEVNSIEAVVNNDKLYRRKRCLNVYRRKRRKLLESENVMDTPVKEEDAAIFISFLQNIPGSGIASSSNNEIISDRNMERVMNEGEYNGVQKAVHDLSKEEKLKQVPDMLSSSSKNKLEILKEVCRSRSFLVGEDCLSRDVSVDCSDDGLESGIGKKCLKMKVKKRKTTCENSSVMDTSTIDLCNEQLKKKNEDKLSYIEDEICETGFYIGKNLKDSKTNCKDKKFFSLESRDKMEHFCASSFDLLDKEEKLQESCNDGFSSLSPVSEGISTFSSSIMRPISRKRFKKVKEKPNHQKDRTSDNITHCDHSTKYLEQKNEVVGEFMEKQMEGFQDCDERNLDLSLTECKIEEKNISSSKVDVISDVVLLAVVNREDNSPKVTHSSPKRAPISHSLRKLLVLDLNGLLADIVSFAPDEYKPDKKIARKALFRRPFCDDFITFCFERFDVGIWSSRTKRNVDSVVDFLVGDMKRNLLFCWDQSHCTETGFNTIENKHKPLVLKELKKLWEKHEPNLPWKKGEYNKSNTLLLDDSPYKALRNPPYTSIFPYPYRFEDIHDNSLGPGGDLRVYLEGLATADDVQKYVEQHTFGQRAITDKNLSWDFYVKVIGTEDSHVPTSPQSNSGFNAPPRELATVDV